MGSSSATQAHLDCQPVPGGGKGRDGEDCQGSGRLLSAKRGEVERHLLQNHHYWVVWMYTGWKKNAKKDFKLAAACMLIDCGWKDFRGGVIK